MPIKLIFLLLFIPLFNFDLLSQEFEEVKLTYRKQQKILSGQLINQLHNGALLVRLNDKQRAVDALRSIGENRKADKLELKQKNFNLKIIKAFREHFNFCPAYFFFNDYSLNVENKNLDSIIFLNDSLIPDSSIRLANIFFLTAECNLTAPDTAGKFNGYYFVRGNNGRERRKGYYGFNYMRWGALIIKSDQFVQLKKPFPYYVRTYDSGPIRRKAGSAVNRMNRKLHRFYNKNLSN